VSEVSNNNFHAHDLAFKNAMQYPRVAKDFLTHHMPRELQARVDLETLKLCKGSYVDESLRSLVTDMLYSVNFKEQKDGKAYLYLLCEHFSNPKSLDGWQLLKYVYRIIDDHVKTHKATVLPVVIPVMITNGARKFPYSTHFCDLFGDNRDLAQRYTLSQFQLVDLSQVPDEEIRERYWSSLLQMLMKHIRSRDIMNILEGLTDRFNQLARQDAEQYVLGMVQYALAKSDIRDIIRFEAFLKRCLPPPLEEKAMTLAQIYEMNGFKEGVQQGIQQGKLDGERKLLTQLLNHRFGTIAHEYTSKIETADADTLLTWGKRVLEAKVLEDVFKGHH
jgi:predicted transposase/invertase (TIGR01784 family)